MLVPAVRTADRPLGPDQYRYIATRGWWMGSFGTSTGLLLHLTEQWIRQWVPARPDRDWMLDREVTGRVRWLTGTAQRGRRRGLRPAGGGSDRPLPRHARRLLRGPRRPARGAADGHLAHPDHDLPLRAAARPAGPARPAARRRPGGAHRLAALRPGHGRPAQRAGPGRPARRLLRRVDRAAGGHPRRGHDGLRGQPAPRARARRRAHPHGADHRSGGRHVRRRAGHAPHGRPGSGSPRAPSCCAPP